MNVIDAIRKESLRLRKERNPVAAAISFAISEIERVGKNNGNRQTTEAEAIKVVQKLVSTIDENLKLDIDDGRRVALNQEKQILLGVLPQMATDREVVDFLRELFSEKRGDNSPKKSEVMKALRDRFGALVDMRRAGQLATEIYGI